MAVFNWDLYNGGLHWLKDRTIYVTEHGSHAYGTNGPTSDYDYKGIAIAPPRYYLGFVDRFEQADKGWEGIDCSVFEIKKFFQLAADNNPNIIELLFCDPQNWVHVTDLWLEIHGARELFLSRNVKARFSGYAMSQLKRIHTHRRWLLNPPTHQPTRTEHGLPEFTAIPKDQLDAARGQIQKQLEAWELAWDVIPDDGDRIEFKNRWVDNLAEMRLHEENRFQAAGRKLGFDENFLEHLGKERAYRSAVSEWKQYQEWLRSRNPARAELEGKFGYDTKHGMHLVRLMRMAREILEGRGVIVKRPDAEELRAIRFEGAWSFDQLISWAEAQDAELEAIKETSPLPKVPDRKTLDELCQKLISYMFTTS